MARKKNEHSPELVSDDLPQEVVNVVSNIQNTVATASELASDQLHIHRLIYARIGRRDAYRMVAKLLTVSDILDLQRIKETKEYKGLLYQHNCGKSKFITTWEDYCRVVEGRSVESIDLDIRNLKQFGDEMFDAMRKVGIGPGKMREIRKLPEDAKAALLTAIENNDTENLLDLAEDLIDQQEKDKAAHKMRADEAEANYEAQGEILAKARTENDQLRQDLSKARRLIKSMSAEEAASEIRKEAAAVAYDAEIGITANLRAAFTDLEAHAAESGIDHRHHMAMLVKHLSLALAAVRDEFAIPTLDHDQMKTWTDLLGMGEIDPQGA